MLRLQRSQSLFKDINFCIVTYFLKYLRSISSTFGDWRYMEGFMLTFTSAIVFFSKGRCKCDWCCEVLIEDIEVMGQSWGASECWPIAALHQRRLANEKGDVRHLRRRGWCDADGDNRILIESSVMRQPRPGLWSHTACYWTLQWTTSKVTLAGKHQYISYATHLNYLA